jgi:hypothetical protein
VSYRALLIGNSVFDEDAGLNPLNAPVKDVARLHRALVDSETGLFDDDLVRLVTERTCDDILDELDRFFASGTRDDLMLLYYSGHGILDERNNLYLCGRDTRSDRLLRTAVSNVRVNEFVAQSMSQRIVIVLDCCSSGMFKGASVGPQLAGPGRYIVSSTRGARLANDAATATGTSLFTEHFVEGMLGGATDGNGDGYIDLREIYDYVRDRLLATTKQVPHCRFDGDAAVSLARVRPPALARVPSTGHPRSTEPTFALAENTITLRDVEPDEQLPPEVIEVIQLGDDPLDLVARSDDQWLEATVTAAGLTVALRPRVGRNRGKILIRDRNSSTAQVLRVEVFVRAGTAAVGATKGLDAPGVEVTAPPAEPAFAPPPPQWPAPAPAPWSPGPPPRTPVPGPLPSARPRGGRSVSRFGVGTAALGGLLLVVAFSGVGWYRISGESGGAGDLGKGASTLKAGLADVWFRGLDWLVVVALILCAVGAGLLAGATATVLARVAVSLAVVGLGLTIGGLAQLWAKLEDTGVSDVGVFQNTKAGLWLALVGFVLAGLAGLFGRFRR